MADRLTKPAPYDGSSGFYGVGVIARRQQDPVLTGLNDAALRLGLSGYGVGTGLGGEYAAQFAARGIDSGQWALAHLAETSPLHLLRALLAQDGTAQMAGRFESALAFGAGNIRFVAVKDWRKGRGVIDDDGTAEVNRVFSLYQANETRPLQGLQNSEATITLPGSPTAPSAIPAALPLLLHSKERINDTGHVLFEATGELGLGVTGIYDFDSLNCRYRDAEINAPDRRYRENERKRTYRVLEHRDKDAKEDKRIGQVDGWRILSGPGIASVAWEASTDNPYGVPRDGAALAYLLRKSARRRDIGDWLHNIAFPKIIVEQAISLLMKLAGEHPELLRKADGTSYESAEWVALQSERIRNKVNSLKNDDVWFLGEGKVYDINPSGINGLTEILTMERLEEIQSLNFLPALLGVTDGGTQAYSEVQWLAQTKGLSLLSAYCSAAPVHIGNYHFRLLGEDLVIRAEFDTLPPIDPQKTAEARKLVMEIEQHLAVIGVNSAKYFAQRMSGSGAVDLPRLEAYLKDALQRLTSAVAGSPVPTPSA